jgi:hypothetical protein
MLFYPSYNLLVFESLACTTPKTTYAYSYLEMLFHNYSPLCSIQIVLSLIIKMEIEIFFGVN